MLRPEWAGVGAGGRGGRGGGGGRALVLKSCCANTSLKSAPSGAGSRGATTTRKPVANATSRYSAAGAPTAA